MNTYDELSNLNESGPPPESRLTDPDHCKNIISAIVSDNESRLKRNAFVKGLVDGNAPYNSEKLAASGQRNRANFNSGRALSITEQAQTAFYDLFSEVPHYAKVTCDTGNPQQDKVWSDILTSEFDRLQRMDPCLDADVQLSQHDMVLYGSGPLIWDNPLDWVTTAKPHNEVLLANNERSDITKWTKMVLLEEYTPAELYKKVENPKVASRVGWYPDNVLKAIREATCGSYTSDSDEWTKAQQNLRNNNLSYSGPDKIIEVGRLFYREFDGSISEAWVHRRKDHGWLYKSTKKYRNWKEVICPFMLNRGDGKYHSVKGLGVRMYAFLLTQERLQCATADLAFNLASVHIRSTTNKRVTPASLVYLGPFTAWQSDFEPVQMTNTQNANSIIEINNNFDTQLQGNLSQFRPQVSQPKGNPRTAFEVAANVNSESILKKTNITRYTEQLDDFYAERFRRATNPGVTGSTETGKMAKKFQQRVEAQGIPLRELREFCVVKATRTVGQGSHFLRSQNLMNLAGTIGPSLPEAGKVNLLDMIIASQTDQTLVDLLNPKTKAPSNIQQQVWEATQENSTLKIGGTPLVTDTQNDLIHVQTHMALVAESLEAINQGLGSSPEELVAAADGALRHTGQHLDRMAQDPLRLNDVKTWSDRWEAAQKLLDGIIQRLQKIQQEQAAVQQAQMQAELIRKQQDPQTIIDVAETQSKMAERDAKTSQQLRHKEERHQQQMRQAAEKNSE